jgi:hypothetical protein
MRAILFTRADTRAELDAEERSWRSRFGSPPDLIVCEGNAHYELPTDPRNDEFSRSGEKRLVVTLGDFAMLER